MTLPARFRHPQFQSTTRSCAVFVSLSLLLSASSQSNVAFKKTLPDAARANGAVSLDGSSYIYYVSPGAEKNKFVIYQKGGGWCFSDENCLQRASTELGSSTLPLFTPTVDYTKFEETARFMLLHSNETLNPQAWNWTRIFLPYLDGGSQIGDVAEPVAVGGKRIFYRGARIHRWTLVTLLSDEGLANATDVILSGGSAGGLATYLHADSWRDAILRFSPKLRFVAVPDSGFFLNYHLSNGTASEFVDQMRWVFTAMNSTGAVPPECLAANAQDPAKCIFAEEVSKTVRAPVFAQQSTYDSFQISFILKNNSAAAINAYGAIVESRVRADLLAPHADSAVFLDSCEHHVGEWGEIAIDGQTVAQALQTFYDSIGKQGRRLWAQGRPYPCAACCKHGR